MTEQEAKMVASELQHHSWWYVTDVYPSPFYEDRGEWAVRLGNRYNEHAFMHLVYLNARSPEELARKLNIWGEADGGVMRRLGRMPAPQRFEETVHSYPNDQGTSAVQ